MNGQHAPTEVTESRERHSSARLHGRWLVLARGLWITLIVLTLAIFFASLPVYVALLQTPCAGTACEWQQLTPGQVGALKEMGLSIGTYAAIIVALTLAEVLVCLVVSTLIISRKSHDRMALLVALMLVTLGPNMSTTALLQSPSPWQVPDECLTFLSTTLLVLVFLLFPSGQFVPRWTGFLFVVFLVGQASIFFSAPLLPNTPVSQLGYLVFLVEAAILVVVQVYRYWRVSSPRERMCWVNRDQTGKIIETYLALFNQVFSVMGGISASVRYKGSHYSFSPEWELFTTNYDNVLETFWRDGIRQHPLNTIFSHDDKSSMQVFNPRRIFETNLKLVKLHGSVTWWLEDGTDTIVEMEQPPSEYGAKKFTGQVLVYPIQQKDTFVPPFLDMFYALKEGLRSHQKWVVIGYSFADDMIRSLFARSSTPNTILVLVHPDQEVATKIKGEPGWKGQIRQILTKFGDPQTSTAAAHALTG